MGRPRKRRREGQIDAEVLSHNVAALSGNAAPSSSAVTQTAEAQYLPNDLNLNTSLIGRGTFGDPPFGIYGFQTDEMASTAGLEPYAPNADDIGQTVNSFPGVTEEQLSASPVLVNDIPTGILPEPTNALLDAGCKCLSSLYSTMSSLQTLPPASFPYTMGILTKASTVARDAIRCQRCPAVYATALQNLMLLCTLLPLIAHEYGKLLNHIDTRASKGDSISFRMGENSIDQIHLHTGTLDCPLSFEVEFSAAEWRAMARKAVRQRVIGSSSFDISVLGLIVELEDRQRSWHAKPMVAEFKHGISCMEHSCSVDEKHTCLQMIFRAKAVVEGLHLTEADNQ